MSSVQEWPSGILTESMVPTRTKVRGIMFSRCKCMGGMFGPVYRHNQYFYCRYDRDQLEQFISIELLMKLFEPLYSHPILKAQRLLNYTFYSLSLYLAFYIMFAVIWVQLGEVTWEWYAVRLEFQGVIYFLILVTVGVANQLVFQFEKNLVEVYIDSLNRAKLRQINLYIQLAKDQDSYLCKDSFRKLSTIEIKRLHS